MREAKPPKIDDKVLYNQIADARSRAGENRPKILWPILEGLYRSYATCLAPDYIPQPYKFAIEDSKALQQNYKSNRSSLFGEMREQALSSADGKCAYCNNSNASELDHYLPKSKFSEFSIFSKNLTPICGRCNKKKRDHYLDAKGRRIFFHPYLDHLPDAVPYLVCSVEISQTILLKFRINDALSKSCSKFDLISEHFERLDLATIYQQESLSELDTRLGAFYAYFRLGTLHSYLEIEAASAAASHGNNHWLPVLFNALARSQQFCDGGFQVFGDDPL